MPDTVKQSCTLPEAVTAVTAGDKHVYLVGTAHVSRQSVEDVRTAIDCVQPDAVCVELCGARHEALINRDSWKQMNIFKVIREKKALVLLAQLILSAFYRKIGEQLGVTPGAEMTEAVSCAREKNAALVLADRDVNITLKRVWARLTLWSKVKMTFHLISSFFVAENIDGDVIEELKNTDQLATMLSTFSDAFPAVKSVLIDERDIYLAEKIRTAPGSTVVAVVGAGHIPGIQKHICTPHRLEPLREVPARTLAPELLKWGLPVAAGLLLAAGFVKGGSQHGMESLYIWIAVNGVFAAIGAAIAFGHPYTVIASFLGAPLTSLNPMLAAGWVAGLVQACVKKPTVADLEDLAGDIASIRGFWINPVSRILLVVVMANLGSSVGTFVSGGWIAARLFR
jgi:pheromone shutdown-related protein TraB